MMKYCAKRDAWLFMTPFGFACGAAGIHDDPDIIGIHLCGRFFGACLAKGLFIGDKTVICLGADCEGDILLDSGEVLLHTVDHVYPGELFAVCTVFAALDNEDLAFTVVDIVFHLRAGEAEHNGDDDKTALCRCSINLHPFDTVVCKDGKAVAFLHTHVGKSIGESAGAFIPLFKGICFVEVLDAYLIRPFEGVDPSTHLLPSSNDRFFIVDPPFILSYYQNICFIYNVYSTNSSK